MTPTEHINADLAAIGLAVASTRELAAHGPWGAISITLTDGRQLLADYGPAGVHAWRWRVTNVEWSQVSAATAGDALAIFDALLPLWRR